MGDYYYMENKYKYIYNVIKIIIYNINTMGNGVELMNKYSSSDSY